MGDRLLGGSYGPASYFQFEKAEEMLSEALDISTKLEDRLQVVIISGHLGWQWVWNGRYEEARALYHETLTNYNDLDYSQSSAFIVQAHLGYPDLYLGEYEAARSHAQHTRTLLREAKHFHTGLSNYSQKKK
jgi:tetratricopeptide (TPR) repeat protein